MNWETVAASRLVESLGWTLAHSTWQIALVALGLFSLRRLTPQNFSANARYLAAVVALAAATLLPVVTFVRIAGNSPKEQARAENLQTSSTRKSGVNARRAENYPEFGDAQSADDARRNADGERFFAAVESLQNFFRQGFSAVLPFVVGLWLLGVAFFALRLSGGVWQMHSFRTREISAPGRRWQKRFAALCGKLEIARRVEFLRSNLVETPVVAGFLKPVILVPASAFLQLNPRELETILAHELVHIRRGDAAVNFAQSVVETLFFYHPCVWWISSVIRREREFATDAAVVRVLENSRVIYASALANLEAIRLSERANQKPLPSFATAAAAKNGGNLMQRIQKILQKNTETRSEANSAWSAGLAFGLISAVLLTVFSFNSGADVNAQATRATASAAKDRKIAVGFVSIPPLDRTPDAPHDAGAAARLLIEKLKSHGVPAVGFVQGGMISPDGEKLYPARAEIVRLWRDAGFEIGIGGFKHIWFYNTAVEDYIANAEKNERLARRILAEKNAPLRWFSYPFLNNGKTASDRERFEAWLGARGLRSAKYTIDNQEWMYSYAYDRARAAGDANSMFEIRAEFIKYMSEMFDHYEAYSREMFGRDIAQTMVLTPSRLVTDAADDLFGMIEKRGYRFVSMDEAQADEAYRTKEAIVESQSGISWFERWQMARGERLRDEPPVVKSVVEAWKRRNDKILPPVPPVPNELP